MGGAVSKEHGLREDSCWKSAAFTVAEAHALDRLAHALVMVLPLLGNLKLQGSRELPSEDCGRLLGSLHDPTVPEFNFDPAGPEGVDGVGFFHTLTIAVLHCKAKGGEPNHLGRFTDPLSKGSLSPAEPCQGGSALSPGTALKGGSSPA